MPTVALGSKAPDGKEGRGGRSGGVPTRQNIKRSAWSKGRLVSNCRQLQICCTYRHIASKGALGADIICDQANRFVKCELEIVDIWPNPLLFSSLWSSGRSGGTNTEDASGASFGAGVVIIALGSVSRQVLGSSC
jgi:hypothetical protein